MVNLQYLMTVQNALITGASSFASSLGLRADIPFGPEALLIFKSESSFLIHSLEMCKGYIEG